MPLTRFCIHHVRNIAEADIAPAATFNFLIGANGSGKTSVLEAIYLLGHGRSFRSAQMAKVISHQQPALMLHGRIRTSHHEIAVGIEKNRLGEGRIRIDGSDNGKTADLAQLLPMQLITPEGFTLLNGGPRYRRAYLDWGCFHGKAGFFTLWRNLRRILKQRNAALRQATRYDQLKQWDRGLVALAETITQWRAEYCTAIAAGISATCRQFLPEFALTFSFHRGWDKECSYGETLARNFERDRLLNYTSSGPHKADLRIRTEHAPVDAVLSRGQLKLLMCALRLAQGEFFTQQTGQSCLYLIDDFASELDEQRRELLATRLKATQAQVFIGAIDPQQIASMMDEKGKMFHLEQGKLIVSC